MRGVEDDDPVILKGMMLADVREYCLLTYSALCVQEGTGTGRGVWGVSRSAGETVEEGTKYTDKQKAVRSHFADNINSKKALRIQECSFFLKVNEWVRGEDSVHNIIRRK